MEKQEDYNSQYSEKDSNDCFYKLYFVIKICRKSLYNTDNPNFRYFNINERFGNIYTSNTK